ncbi:MAG: DUF4115 domain-containing protein [Chloroflexi bacterium]|nr:DUF4115 domain-containing protein [Chloroflexota bacterium]
MNNTASIGSTLKQERDRKGLSLDDVHDATKITVHNLSALEEDRFDYFPNRVYARAFLRDYANYLGLDSGALLTDYEEKWGAAQEIKIAPEPPRRSAWKAVGYMFLVMVVIVALGAAAYVYRAASERHRRVAKAPSGATSANHKPAGATLPKVEPILPKKPEAAQPGTPKPAEPKPLPPPVPDKLTLQVSTLVDDWVRITADGKKLYEGIIPAGKTQVWEAKKKIKIRAGKAGGVQLKLNGVTQPPLGSLGAPGQKEFTMPVPEPTPATPVTITGASPTPQPVPTAKPPAGPSPR